MKLFKRLSAIVLAAVMIVTLLPATLTSAALYEGLMEQDDGRLAYVQENPAVPMGSVAAKSVNSSGKANNYTTTYTVEEGNVIVMDEFVPAMSSNSYRDWIGVAGSKFIITDNYQAEKTKTYYEHESAYLEDEIPIEPLISETEGIDHTATLADDAKEVEPGTYTYLENGKPTIWTITLGELVEPSGADLYTIVTDKNAIVEYEGNSYIVIDGYAATDVNGLREDPEDPSTSYYFVDGIVQKELNGIIWDGDQGYYLVRGRFNPAFTGFSTYEGCPYYVSEGLVDSSANGIIEDPATPGTFYYVIDGQVQIDFSGTIEFEGEEYEVENGVCVKSEETPHVVITCSDRHDNTDILQNILSAMPAEPAPEAAIHNGDAVNSGAFAFADVTAEFAEIFPSLDGKVFYSYGSHDSDAAEYDAVEPEGVMYETEDYIFYDISMNNMEDAELAAEGAAAFTEAAASFDTSKVLFVASHMPLHTRRSDNVGAAAYFDAINEVAATMDTIVLWSHNHTGENNVDAQHFLRMPGESMTPQGGSAQTANFIYANAGYIISGYMTQWTITDSTIKVQRYNEEGAVGFHDGITYPVVYNRNTGTLVAGDINHAEAGSGEPTSGGGGGGFNDVESYITASQIAAAKNEPDATAGPYVFAEEKNSSTTFTWTITLNEDGTYDVEEVRATFGTSTFHGESWSAEGTFVTLGPNDADSRKGGWFDPAGLYMIVYPDTMTFLPSLTAEGNPDETQTGWVKEDDKWYYYNEDGEMVTGWLQDGSKWYYLNEDGSMATGWKQVNGKWYYLNAGGSMATGWKQVDGKWYYLNAGGSMATGWKQVDGKWYFLNSNGSMATGWLKDGNKWYYLNASGSMATGWKQVGSTWYYFKDSGAMATGWLQVGSKWYYFKSSGAMVTGRVVIDGRTSIFASSGAWQGYAN